MALTPDGHAALSAILAHPDLFPRIRAGDLANAATKLARKQLIAAGLTPDDLLQIKSALSEEVFEKTLDSLSPHHIKLLARRLDPNAPEIEVNTGSSALAHVRSILAGNHVPTEAPSDTTPADNPAPTKNKYLGRKAFRTGR